MTDILTKRMKFFEKLYGESSETYNTDEAETAETADTENSEDYAE